MSGRFGATVVIDRPIDEVFAFLADGENDTKFSPRVLEITKTTDGPPGVGTVFASTVKDVGVKTRREFKHRRAARQVRRELGTQGRRRLRAVDQGSGGSELAVSPRTVVYAQRRGDL
jgi:hypothetical protein